MIKIIIISSLIFLYSLPACAENRLILIDNSYESIIDRLVRSLNDENLDDYSDCFAAKDKKRKERVSEFFLRTECSFEVTEKHIVEKTDKSLKLAISYKSTDLLNKVEHTFGSFLILTKVKEEWKISSERILFKNSVIMCESGTCGSDAKPICFGNECKL